MTETHVKVYLFWGGEVVYEAGSVRYNRGPEIGQRFPISLKYDRLQRVLRSKMFVNDPELSVVITGRCPSSFTADGSPIYGEMPITDDESLSSFLRCPEIFKNHICIAALDMYATVQRSTQVEVPTDNEFDFGGTTYLPSLNIGFSRGVVQQQTIVGFGSQSNDTTNYGTQYDGMASTHDHNFDWSGQNRETGGPNNATTQLHNLNCNVRHPSHPGPSELDSDR